MTGTSLLDPNILRNDPTLESTDTGFWDQFGKGLNSSVTGTHAGLRGMAGTIGEMAGADEFAQDEFQRARELQAEAQAQGPRVGSYKNVGGLRDAVSYAGGILGGSAPSMALGMGAGMAARTALGGLAAGTVAQTPLEAADVAMKQLNDPEAMAQPAGERFARQLGGGAASAGLQTIIPNMVGGKLVGRGAEQAAQQSLKQIAGRNAMSIPAEGFFEGSSEALKQTAANSENDLNWDQIGENVVGGMVGGAPMAGAGFVGDAASRVAPQAQEAFGSARESINERVARMRGAAGEQLDAAAATAPGKKVKSAYDDIADMVERGKGKFDDTLDKILKGEELGDPGDWLRATTDEAKKRMADFSDNERVKAATQWGKDLLNKLRPDDPRRGTVEAADPNTVDGQMLIASEKKKFDASEDADAKIDALSEALGSDVTDVVDKNEAVQTPAAAPAKPTIAQRKQFIDEAMASGMTKEQARTAFVESMNGPRLDDPTPPEVPKLSADYSGVQKMIADAIKDNGIVSRRPELFDTDRKIEAISRNMRILLEQLPKGPLDEAVIKSVTRVFGDDTDSVINSLKRTLAVDLSPQESENFFGNLRLMKDINDGEKGLHDVMRSSLTDEARTRQQMTEKDAEALIKHARGQMGAERTAEKEHFDRLVDEYYKNNFGDKADTVRAAVEKAAGLDQGVAEDGTVKAVDDAPESEGGFDEGGSRIEAAAQDKVIYGLSAPDAKGNSKSELGGAAMLEGSRYAKQHELDLKAKFPDKDVYFERLPDSDYGHVVVEDRSNPGEFNAADLAAMKHDTKKYPNSPSRLSVGGHIIDAVKVAKVMRGKLQDRFEGDSPTTAVQRLVDGFKQGIAQLTEQFGEVVNVPDSAVIGFKAGNKPLTWGEAQRVRSDTAEDRMSEVGQAKLAELRKEYKTASAKDKAEILAEVRKLVDFERDRELVGDTDETAGARYAEKMNDTRIANVMGDRKQRFGDGPEPKEIKDGRYDAEGNLTKAGAHDLLMGDADGGINVAAPSKALHELDRVGTSSGEGRSDVSADENPHLVAAIHGKKMKRGANMDGSAHYVSDSVSAAERLARSEMKAGIANWRDTGTAPATRIADRADRLLSSAYLMSEKDRTALFSLAGGTAAQASSTVNALARKYKDQIVATNKEGSPDPKPQAPKGAASGKKQAFLKRAAEGDKALLEELRTSDDAKGLQRALDALNERDFDGSEGDDNVQATFDVLTSRLAELAKNPDVAYGLQTAKYSLDATQVNASNQTTQADRDAVKAHILKVLGTSVKVAWKNLTNMQHAGDYTHSLKLIRLSVHAINPMSTGYHESLHAFFAQLRDAGATDITRVLEKAASSQLVIEQLNTRYKNQPEVLKQLKDPEERAAYMYQMWASDPSFKVTIAAKGVFGRIKQFIQRLAGAWTNDERALHIMDYFHSGEYAKNMGSPSAVRHALMDTHRSQILETAQSFTEPLGRLADAVVGTGGARLRDTGVPALEQLADIMKREHTSEGGDQGFISASRIEGAKMRTRLGELLSPYTTEQLHDAMEALQSNTPAVSTEAQQAAKDIKGFLRGAHAYMTKAGVNIGDLGPDYFPRVWDTHYISKNQQAFRDMLEPYIRSGKMKGSADDLIRSLLAREGAEFGIESREPGMQHKKERLLDFITAQDAAQFVEKNLLATMSSYINQATRKAEWTRRLGGGKLDQLLDDARSQGATTEQLDVAEDYMKGIDGTLGSTGGPFEMTPTVRRLMGDMIVYQNIRLLPMAAFSMLIDPMGIMVRGGSVGQAYDTFKRGLAGIKDTFKNDDGSNADQATRWAELVGVVDSAMMTHAMSDIYSQGMVGGTAKKINNAFFKFNLVEGLNRNFRIGASEAAMKFMAHHAGGLSGKGPSAHSVRWMKELGLQKGDIVLTPAGHIALTRQDGLSEGQVVRVHAAINQWVDGAVLRPDAADKPIWMNDPHYALISHLKQFVFSFQKTILARVAHEFRNGNYTPSMALASYVPVMIAADTAKGLFANAGDTPEWKKGWSVADHVGYGIERAGLFGVGQFGIDIIQDLKRGDSGVGALTGPTIEQLGDIVSALGGHKQFGNTVLDALPANALLKGWSGKGEAKADPVAES